MRRFRHFAAIDWSGEAIARPKGLAVALAADGSTAPALIRPEKGWSRAAILDWLRDQADAQSDMLIGLDLSPSLPFADSEAFFPGWRRSPPDAKALWALVDRLSQDDPHLSVPSFLAHDEIGRHFREPGRHGDLFPSGRGRLRVCEERQRSVMELSPYSCFNLIGAAQVGKSSLTGMRVLHALRGAIPVWPFDPVPARGPAIVEIYTSLAAREAGMPKGRSKMRDADSIEAALAALGSDTDIALDGLDDHSSDALVTAAWLRGAANDTQLWNPRGLDEKIAATEGWTFGVR